MLQDYENVLIAPLWNWNSAGLTFRGTPESSNRTFMELKYTYWLREYRCYCVLIAPLWNWNTLGVDAFGNCSLVLIAPLWNWNTWKMQSWRKRQQVLIAPLWNWNNRAAVQCFYTRCSNRTFMELKYCLRLQETLSPGVLIAPLWNWNYSEVKK